MWGLHGEGMLSCCPSCYTCCNVFHLMYVQALTPRGRRVELREPVEVAWLSQVRDSAWLLQQLAGRLVERCGRDRQGRKPGPAEQQSCCLDAT